jgi:hypothetical protein
MQYRHSSEYAVNEAMRYGNHERDEVLPILKIQIPESDVQDDEPIVCRRRCSWVEFGGCASYFVCRRECFLAG